MSITELDNQLRDLLKTDNRAGRKFYLEELQTAFNVLAERYKDYDFFGLTIGYFKSLNSNKLFVKKAGRLLQHSKLFELIVDKRCYYNKLYVFNN